MILGLSVHTFTVIHVLISLVGIVAGVIVAFAMVWGKSVPGWTALALLALILTSVTGFFFHNTTFTPAQGECVVDTTNNRICVGDGATPGGNPALNTLAPLNTFATGANGSLSKAGIIEQLVSGLSGASVNAPTQIPAGALVKAVGMRVTTAITGPASESMPVNSCSWALAGR